MSEYPILFEQLVAPYTSSELEQMCKSLNRLYNIFDSNELRWSQIMRLFTKTSPDTFAALKEAASSNQILNDLIFQYYHCERVVKYFLIKKLKELKNNIVAFEMCVGQSRVDICRINGESYAYEIKTEYDSFDRLPSQMDDYIKTFERVYLVIPHSLKSAAEGRIPETCGILTYSWDKNGSPKFRYAKQAKKNDCNFRMCAEGLSSADLSALLHLFGEPHPPALKNEKLALVLQYAEKINPWPAYKNFLKAKFSSRWTFITENFSDIIPLDVQTFFSTSSDPKLTYMH